MPAQNRAHRQAHPGAVPSGLRGAARSCRCPGPDARPPSGSRRTLRRAAIFILVAAAAFAGGLAHPGFRQAAHARGYAAFSRAEAAWYLWRLGARYTIVSHGLEILVAPGEQSDVDLLGRPRTSAPMAAQAEWVAESVARAFEGLLAATGLTGLPANPPRVVVYPNAQAMALSWGWPAGRGAGGAYWPGAVQIVAPGAWLSCGPDGPDGEAGSTLLATVGHELTHWAFEGAALGRIPRWLSEGLAQRAEERLIGSEAAVELIRMRARSAGAVPIREFSRWFSVRHANQSQERRAYVLARSIVAYLDSECEPGWESRLASALRESKTLRSAFLAATGLMVTDLERQWEEWVWR